MFHPRPSGRGPIEAQIPVVHIYNRLPIRDLAVAAPLKQAIGDDLGGHNLHAIRDLAVAAPLKHSTHPNAVHVLRPIRDLAVAAPLKRGGAAARQGRRPSRPPPVHPRPSGRGPIEAARCQGVPRPASTAIRDLAVAAPLKLPTSTI